MTAAYTDCGEAGPPDHGYSNSLPKPNPSETTYG